MKGLVAMAMHGADIEELRVFAKSLQVASESISDRCRALDSLVFGVSWEGADAEQARTSWANECGPTLKQASVRLLEASDSLIVHADQQAEASAAEGNGAGFLGGAIGTPGGVASTLGGSPPETKDSSREDERRDSRRDARREAGDEDVPVNTVTIPGSKEAFPSGLGEPVAGKKVVVPRPPEWSARDGGSGEWDSEDADVFDHIKDDGARAGANLLSAAWPNAARNLHHYLDNSGETLAQPVDDMLNDMPAFESKVKGLELSLGAKAIAKV